MPKVTVIGKHANILPFKAVGVEPIDVDSVEEAKVALRKLRDADEETLVLISEDWALACEREIAALRQEATNVVMTLPSLSGSVGAQREHVRQMVARSLGVDLMGKAGSSGS